MKPQYLLKWFYHHLTFTFEDINCLCFRCWIYNFLEIEWIVVVPNYLTVLVSKCICIFIHHTKIILPTNTFNQILSGWYLKRGLMGFDYFTEWVAARLKLPFETKKKYSDGRPSRWSEFVWTESNRPASTKRDKNDFFKTLFTFSVQCCFPDRRDGGSNT